VCVYNRLRNGALRLHNFKNSNLFFHHTSPFYVGVEQLNLQCASREAIAHEITLGLIVEIFIISLRCVGRREARGLY
jgi:hypothetical protein